MSALQREWQRYTPAQRIALERNGEIVPRSQLDQVALADGDTLEIVVAVGGG